nr:hypothetical protein JVH1_0352 [Rhodococcus sp. JVH1]
MGDHHRVLSNTCTGTRGGAALRRGPSRAVGVGGHIRWSKSRECVIDITVLGDAARHAAFRPAGNRPAGVHRVDANR